ncbi:MAG: TMEM165/GDT1 family protein [Candidatus Bathyarchaeia archaeon]
MIRYNASMVFIGTLKALTLLSVAAIYLGKAISDKVDKASMDRIAGVAFMAIGASMIIL